ncbi:hypothetical protein ACQKK5_08270 [Brevibacillus panacihumi]|uniref:hypothetical protein n=1 Tax=Brevibacillus panacihumi TaxID=497735 RepID=UPI003D008504
MEIDSNYNVIEILTVILGWLAIIFFAYTIYQKQMVKPKVWEIPLIILVGLFSFSINWRMFDVIVQLPILPLGVWILYFVFKGKDQRWQTCRSFAWLGFGANFIFLASTLLTLPVHHVIYPKDDLSVYISNVENASIINIHPSAKDRSLNKDSLLKQLDTMRQEAIYSDQWYKETYMDPSSSKRNERFPYLLIGTSSKWGSGLHALIYIEDDGKGILLSTPKKELYFRSKDSLLEGGE